MITAIKEQTRGKGRKESSALHCMGKEQRDYCYHANSRRPRKQEGIGDDDDDDDDKGSEAPRMMGHLTSQRSVGPAAVNSAASDPLSPLLVVAGSLLWLCRESQLPPARLHE